MFKPWMSLPLAALVLLPVVAVAATGTVVLAETDAMLEQAGQWLPAKLGMTVEANAAITGAGGRLQLRMADGALIALPANSKIAFEPGKPENLSLLHGGMRLTTPAPNAYWTVQALGRTLRSSGFIKLQHCANGCTLAPGLYGQASGGETVVEYTGGRAVLRTKIFRLPTGGSRPEILVKAPSLLEDASNLTQAESAHLELSQRLHLGIEAFRSGNFAAAQVELAAVQAQNPAETVVSYYLGLIALEKQDNAQALLLLQRYMKEDPQAALDRDVPKTVTLLSTSQLQDEVASALAQEKTLTNAPPEPNSIAVQTFASRGDPIYRAMAKGIAAVVIADLTQVPGLKVLEREKVQKIMAEMRLGDSGLTDDSTAVKTGRLMRAEKVIVGSFGAQ